MGKKLIILFGISGSGKTTYRNRYLKTHKDTVVINMDNIRVSMSHIDDMSNNGRVAREAKNDLKKAFEEGRSVIWDNTTLSPKYLRAVYEGMPEDYTLEILYTKRSYDPKSCIMDIMFDRIAGIPRSNVPDNIVMKQYERFIHLISWIKNQAPSYVANNLKEIEVF